MRKSYIGCLVAVAALSAGCAEEKTVIEEVIHEQPVAFTFKQNVDGPLQVQFSAGDRLGVNGHPCTILANGEISLYEVPAVAEYAVYYPSDAVFEKNRLGFTVSSSQNFKENGVEASGFPLYALTDNEGFQDLSLNAVCGGLQIVVPAAEEGFTSITSAVIKSSDDVLAGDVSVDLLSGEITHGENVSNSLTLKGGIDLTEGNNLYLSVLPVTFSEDLELTLFTLKGQGTCKLPLSGKTVESGKLLTVNAENIEWKSTTHYYGTANSVIVAPGTKSVTVDCTSYYTTDLNYSYENLPAEDDRLPLSAGLLWNDVSTGFVSGVTLSEDRRSFVAELTGEPGNAVVAIYDKADPDEDGAKILWSFHLWVTDVNDQSLGVNVKGNSYTVLDRNLGAVSAVPGDVRSIGLLYEWGRKDPFVSTSKVGENKLFGLYNQHGGVKESTKGSSGSVGTVAFATENPLTYITDTNSKSNTSKKPYQYAYDWMQYADDALWGNPLGYKYPSASTLKKSVYDPCPEGYMVPPRDAWMSSDSEQLIFERNGAWDAALMGYKLVYNGQEMWYPATGVRSAKKGNLTACNEYGCCLFSCPENDKNAQIPFIKITKSGVVKAADRRGNAYPVRCVRESK